MFILIAHHVSSCCCFCIQVSHCHANGETQHARKILKTLSPPAEHSGIAAGSSDTWAGQDLVRVPVTVPTGLNDCNIIDVEHQLVVSGRLHCFGRSIIIIIINFTSKARLDA